MGGPSAASAYAATTNTAEKRQRLDAAVHSLRKTTQYGAQARRNSNDAARRSRHNNNSNNNNNNNNDENDSDGNGSDGATMHGREHEANGFLSDDYDGNRGNDNGYEYDDDDDDNDDYDDYDEDEVRAAAALERDEMKRHFNFPLEKRRSLKNQLMSAMHKKRRLLMRSENLRFRELYKPPEPGVLLVAATIVTIVTLILTKSWPFYSSSD